MQFRKNQIGALVIPLIVSVVLLFVTLGFGIWTYTQFLDQRDNSDQKIAVAVSDATTTQKTKLEADFAEAEKVPNRTWVSSPLIGSITITYPKNWSAYVEEKESGANLLDAYFHPKVVANAATSNHALRVVVDESKYETAVSSFDKLIESGDVRTSAINISGVTGAKFSGQIDKDYQGVMAVFKVRDKTLKIWTESNNYAKDFNDIVLPGLSFEK